MMNMLLTSSNKSPYRQNDFHCFTDIHNFTKQTMKTISQSR